MGVGVAAARDESLAITIRLGMYSQESGSGSRGGSGHAESQRQRVNRRAIEDMEAHKFDVGSTCLSLRRERRFSSKHPYTSNQLPKLRARNAGGKRWPRKAKT